MLKDADQVDPHSRHVGRELVGQDHFLRRASRLHRAVNRLIDHLSNVRLAYQQSIFTFRPWGWSLPAPEELARENIDALLEAAGWVLQDRDAFDRTAAVGVAVREFPLGTGYCDYLLFVDGKAAGVIEAKPAGVTLSGVAEQSDKYMSALPEHLARWDEMLVYDYESTGGECQEFRVRRGG